MIISEAQLQAFRLERDQPYYEALRSWFREQYPAETKRWDEAELLKLITASVRRARDRGVESPHAILRYVGMAVLVEPEFDRQPQVIAFLEAPGFDPDYKIHLLSDMLISKLRQA